ncbi:tetraspanin-33-like isoform X1 [Haemaphysalis longicornis]
MKAKMKPFWKQPQRFYRAFLLSFNLCLMVIAGSVASAGMFSFSERSRMPSKQMTYFNTLLMRLSVNLELAVMMSGGAVFLVAVLGFLGTLRDSLMALRLYMACMFDVTFLAFVGTALITFTPFMANNVFHRYLKPDLVRYYRQSSDWDDLLDHMQSSFKCCGVSSDSYKDWNRNSVYKCANSNPSAERCSVPDSCCTVQSKGCGKDVLRHNWNDVKNRIHKRNCLDTVLASVRSNVVTIAGMGMLCSVGFLLVMASAREYINGLRGTAYRHLDESRLASQKLVSRAPSLAAAAAASPLSARSKGSGLHIKADEYVMDTAQEDAHYAASRAYSQSAVAAYASEAAPPYSYPAMQPTPPMAIHPAQASSMHMMQAAPPYSFPEYYYQNTPQ